MVGVPAAGHMPEPLQVRLPVSMVPLQVASAHWLPDFLAQVPVAAEHAPVFPHPIKVVSGAQAVEQQTPADPVALALTQNPLAQSAPLLALLAVLHVCPLAFGSTHCVLTQT